jgi:hypothetical protein
LGEEFGVDFQTDDGFVGHGNWRLEIGD